MSIDPWEIARTEEGRGELVELIAQRRAAGDNRGLGVCLSRLAYFVKHLGSTDGSEPFPTSAKLAAEAVELLRQTDDRKELSRALRIAAVPLVSGIDPIALLNESLAIALKIGDQEQEGWTRFRMTLLDGVEGHTVEEALACFEACGCLEGQAYCLLNLGFMQRPKDISLIDRAADLFEESGNLDEATKARTISAMFT